MAVNLASLERVEAPVTFKAYLMCAFAAFAGMLFGYDSGYISSVLGMEKFKQQYGHVVPISMDAPDGYDYYTWEKSLIVSILSAGTCCGAIISGSLADRLGRKLTIIGPGCSTYAIGVLTQVLATNVPGLATGRFISGLGVGCVSAITIIYMSEIAPRKVRGALVSLYQFAITIGIMLASSVGYATQNREDTGAFRIPIAVQFLWALILAGGLMLLPESPRFYVKQNQLDKALHALARVRGQAWNAECIEDELAEIVANLEYEQHVGSVTFSGCLSGGIKNPNSNIRKILIGMSLQMMQQWTGINFIFYYNTTFFQQVGVTNPFLISMVTTIVNVVSTPLSFYAVEKFGRRPLLIYGAIGMAISEFIVAIVGTTVPTSQAATYCLIIFVCAYVAFFAATWGPCAWVVIGEIFHLPLRSKGVALSTASNWFWNCIIGVVTPFIVDPGRGDLGVHVFYVWGATCAGCALFAYLLVPETKGLTLEQVDQMMQQTAPYESHRWRPQDTFAMDFGVAGAGPTAPPPTASMGLGAIPVEIGKGSASRVVSAEYSMRGSERESGSISKSRMSSIVQVDDEPSVKDFNFI